MFFSLLRVVAPLTRVVGVIDGTGDDSVVTMVGLELNDEMLAVGTLSRRDLLAAATAVKCRASEVEVVDVLGTSDSTVLVVQSLETDLRPSTE